MNPSGNGTRRKVAPSPLSHSCWAAMPPASCAPIVRPWNALRKETITRLAGPCRRSPQVLASLMAASLASLPVVTTNTV